MSPRLRLAALLAALAAAWWLGTRTERVRQESASAIAKAETAEHSPREAEAAAREHVARNVGDKLAADDTVASPARQPITAEVFAARIATARRGVNAIQRMRRLVLATGDLSAEEIPAVLAFTEQATPGDEKEILSIAVLARWAEIAPHAAAAYVAQQLTSGRDADPQRLAIAISEWGSSDPTAAADFVATLDEESRSEAISALLTGVAANQPEGALALLARFPEAARNRGNYEVIFGAWGGCDPRTAAARASALPVGALRVGAHEGLADQWAKRDPAAAYAWASQLPDPAERTDALRRTLEAWAERDPQVAAQRTIALGDATIARGVADDISRRLDIPAAQRFAAQLTDPHARNEAMSAVVLNLTDKSCLEAAAYASQMPEGDQRGQALSNLTGSWAQRDPVANAQWLATLPASGSRDAAVKTYVERTLELDPEAALAWAASIGAEEKRSEVLAESYQAWRKKSPQAAQAWLAADRTLPAELKTALAARK